MHRRILGTAMSVCLLALSGASFASSFESSIRDITVIQSPGGDSRVLFRISDTSLFSREIAIAKVWLRIPLPATRPEAPVHVQAHPILTNWSAGGVGWTSGWSTPGGDIHEELYARGSYDGGRAQSQLTLDLSVILTEFVDGMEMYGFLLTVPPFRGDGFRGEEIGILSRLSEASLEVSYRPLIPGPLDRTGREKTGRKQKENHASDF
jgi:hypothetical protein